MNAKEFIEKYLQDCRYNSVLTKEAENVAKENGLVVVFGASDDLCEFRGAVDDEVGCYDGDDIYINAEGKIANNDDEFDDFDPEDFPEYKLISAVWCERSRECSWSYRTDIPHEEFTVWDEDNTYYCFGIVFNINDLKPKTAADDYVRKTDAISVICSAFDWYEINFGIHRNDIETLKRNMVESIKGLPGKSI